MAAPNFSLERTGAGKFYVRKDGLKVGNVVPNGELKGLFNMYKKIPVYQLGGNPKIWVWEGTGRRGGPVSQNANKSAQAAAAAAAAAGNNGENVKADPYVPNTPNARAKFIRIRNNWGLKSNSYLQKWLGTQTMRTGATANSIMNSIIRHSNNLNKNTIKSAFSKIRSGEALYSAAPVGEMGPNARVNEYLRNVAFDEMVRKFTPALRQAHSGSLFEQAAIAIAAKAAGKIVKSFPKTGLANTNNFTPNRNTRKYYEGNRISQVWTGPAAQKNLETGVFVLKSAFGLGRIKTNENNPKFKELFFNLVKTNAKNNARKSAQTSYNTPPGGLLGLVGKNANTSLWKGFYEVQPDVLYFVLDHKDRKLKVYIYEFKIGSGHAQAVPAEYFQLVKAKRTLEKIFELKPPALPAGYNYEITIHFFPLKYRLIGQNAPTNFAHPNANYIDPKWKKHYKEICKPEYAVHGTYAIKDITTPAQFLSQTGVDIEVVKKVLDAYSKAAERGQQRHLRHRERHGLYAPGNERGMAAVRKALSVNNLPPNVRESLEVIAMGGTRGPNYIASLMRAGAQINTPQELVSALFYLDVAGFRLKQKTGNNAGAIKPILPTLNIPEKGLLNTGSTWSGVKKPRNSARHQATIRMLLERIDAAKSAPAHRLGGYGKWLLERLAPYNLEPPAPTYMSNAAQNKRVELRNKAEELINTPQPQFRAVYSKFIKDHIVPAASLGLTPANAKQAFLNVLNSAAKLANGRGNMNRAEAYRTRMNLVNSL